MESILIKNASVVDGSGSAAFQADVLIRDGVIAALRPGLEAEDARVMEAGGRILTPGFIDSHSHGDLSAPAYPGMESALCQGITTLFAGHCGMGAAPADKYWMHSFFEDRAFARAIPPPTGGQSPGHGQIVDREAIAPAFQEVFGFALDWEGMGGYMAHMERAGMGANLALVAGHGQIRLQVMGADFRRPATEKQLDRMLAYVNEVMDSGGAGISLGLDYDPGMYAEDAELYAVARAVAKRDGLLTVHCQRRDSRRGVQKRQHYIDGLREALDLALHTGVRLNISHLSRGYVVEPYDAPLLEQAALRTLAVIEEYRQRGVDVYWDVIPPGCGGMFHFPHLGNKFMPYVADCGGLEAFGRKITIGSYRDDLSRVIRSGRHASVSPFTRLDPVTSPNWDAGVVITACADKALVGQSLRQIARDRSMHFVDAMLDLLRLDPYTCFDQPQPRSAPDIDIFVRQPDAAIDLDCGVFDFAHNAGEPGCPAIYAAPATYCGMVGFLRDELDKGRGLEATIAKMTGNAARNIGLADRGLVREGMIADLVLLDRDTLAENRSVVDPRQAPSGIVHVLVGGVPAVADGQVTGQRRGKIIRFGGRP